MRPETGATMSQNPMTKKPASTGGSRRLFISLSAIVMLYNWSKLRYFSGIPHIVLQKICPAGPAHLRARRKTSRLRRRAPPSEHPDGTAAPHRIPIRFRFRLRGLPKRSSFTLLPDLTLVVGDAFAASPFHNAAQLLDLGDQCIDILFRHHEVAIVTRLHVSVLQ